MRWLDLRASLHRQARQPGIQHTDSINSLLNSLNGLNSLNSLVTITYIYSNRYILVVILLVAEGLLISVLANTI